MATYWRGFDDADGISDWTQVAVGSGQTDPAWSIVNTDQLQATSASSHNEALVWNDIDADGDRADFEILCQVYVDVTTASQRVLAGRISTSGATRTGYAVRLRTNSFDTYRFNGATFTLITAGTFSVASGTWCWVRFRVNGTTIRARAWADGDSEPGTWQCDTTDSTYSTAGHVGALKGANTNTQLWRYFGVGTNGDTAPASASSGVSGSLSKTLAGATVSAAGALKLSGAAAASLQAASLSSAGKVALTGALSKSLDGATVDAEGSTAAVGINGELSATLDGASLSAAGAVALSCSLSASVAGASLSAACALQIEGATAATLEGATLSAAGSGQQITTGALAATLAGASVSAASAVALRGQVSSTLDGATLSAGGHVDITAALGVTLDGASIVAAGSAPGAAITGSLFKTLAGATLVAAGSEAGDVEPTAGYVITGRARRFEVDGRARRFEVNQ